MMRDFEIKGIHARVKLGPLSFTISQDETVEQSGDLGTCPKCFKSWPLLIGSTEFKVCPYCAAPLENP